MTVSAPPTETNLDHIQFRKYFSSLGPLDDSRPRWPRRRRPNQPSILESLRLRLKQSAQFHRPSGPLVCLGRRYER
jgi:hypothetical protein